MEQVQALLTPYAHEILAALTLAIVAYIRDVAQMRSAKRAALIAEQAAHGIAADHETKGKLKKMTATQSVRDSLPPGVRPAFPFSESMLIERAVKQLKKERKL